MTLKHLLTTIICLTFITASASLSSASGGKGTKFTKEELSLIHSADSIMRVLTIEGCLDLAVLRAPSKSLSNRALHSEDFSRLTELMLATVNHPSQNGVGIAGPQVGLNRRVVAVQRFDKPAAANGEHPFEVYPNIRIVWASDTKSAGPEGCLSVPGKAGIVMRSTEIIIEYSQPDPKKKRRFITVQEKVSGYTAVIFQHEIDHLDGFLYTDRATEIVSYNQ